MPLYGYSGWCAQAGIDRQIRRFLTVRRITVLYRAYDADFTLPRKSSKENKGNRTPNRHR